MIVALVQFCSLLHEYLESLLEAEHLEKLEVLLAQLLSLQLCDQSLQNSLLLELLVALAWNRFCLVI